MVGNTKGEMLIDLFGQFGVVSRTQVQARLADVC
jgi:hypothetical protein